MYACVLVSNSGTIQTQGINRVRSYGKQKTYVATIGPFGGLGLVPSGLDVTKVGSAGLLCLGQVSPVFVLDGKVLNVPVLIPRLLAPSDGKSSILGV